MFSAVSKKKKELAPLSEPSESVIKCVSGTESTIVLVGSTTVPLPPSGPGAFDGRTTHVDPDCWLPGTNGLSPVCHANKVPQCASTEMLWWLWSAWRRARDDAVHPGVGCLQGKQIQCGSALLGLADEDDHHLLRDLSPHLQLFTSFTCHVFSSVFSKRKQPQKPEF